MPWISYADRFEDVILHRSLEEVSEGTYVDIGPLDPTQDSITKHFSDRGWSGLNVVEDPRIHSSFCESRPKDINLCIATAPIPDGTNPKNSFTLAGRVGTWRSLAAVLEDKEIETVHFFRAASTGWQGQLLREFPFSRAKPWIVILQGSGHPEKEMSSDTNWDSFLTSRGYQPAHFDGRSRFYLSEEHSRIQDRLAATPRLSDDFIPAAYAEEMESLRKHSAELARLTSSLIRANQRLEEKRQANALRRFERGLRRAFRGRVDKKESADSSEVKVPPSPGPVEVLRFSGVRALGNDIGERPRILVVQVDHIGDFVNRLPAMGLLRSLWPKADIDVICGPWNVPLARKCGYFEKVVPFAFFPERTGDWRPSREKLDRIGAEFARLSEDLGDYDLAIDLRPNPDTRSLLKHVRAKLRGGYAAPEVDVFLDVSLPNPEHLSWGEKNRTGVNRGLWALLLVRAIEATLCLQGALDPHPLTFRGRRNVSERVERLVAVAFGSGSSARKWGTSHFASVCRILAVEHRCSILLFGSACEQADAERIARGIPASRCRNLVGKINLGDVPRYLLEAHAFIGNDSGASHIAASLGVPTVVVHSGATDVHLAHPLGEKVSVMRIPTSCSPCWLARAEDCPHAMACLERMSPEAVVREVLFWLEQESGSGSRMDAEPRGEEESQGGSVCSVI